MAHLYFGVRDPYGAPHVLRWWSDKQPGFREWRPSQTRHSPDGFNWGYDGSGPAELARHLLADACGRPDLLHRPDLYQRYKREVVGRLGETWRLDPEEIRVWVDDHDQAGQREELPDDQADDEPIPCDRCDQLYTGPRRFYMGPDGPARGAALYASVCPTCHAELMA